MILDYHFDNCEFRGSSNTINSLYNRAINSLNPSSPDIADARNAFGQLLHTVQDFYSHSNWVELGQTDLVENGLNLWHVFSPFEVYRGFVVIQGEDAPSGVTLSRTGKIITANMPDGVFQGLITGAAYTTDDCPDDVTIGHWDSGGLGGNWPGENERLDGLNKDANGRPGYSEARSLAVQQTTHEWCRLLNLENTRNGGDGVKLIFQQWVNDQEGAIAACPELSDLRQIVSDTSEAIPDGQEGQMTCPDGSVGTSCPEGTGASTPPAEDTPGQMTCPDGSVGTSCPEENVVPPSTVCDPNSQILRKGDNGEIVITLQNLLTERGYNPGTIDGDFGPGTEGAVIQFQTDNGLTADGIVGAGTWQELCSLSEPPSEDTPGQMTCPDGSVGTSCPEGTGASTPPAEDTPGQMTCPDGIR